MNEDLERAIALHAKLFGLSKSEAKEDAEAIIRGYMENEHVPREFAESTFIEETEDINPEELKHMEEEGKKVKLKAKSTKTVDAYGKAKTRERKPNANKRNIIKLLHKVLATCADSIQEMKETEEHKIDFAIGEKEYTVTLTEHRKKKE